MSVSRLNIPAKITLVIPASTIGTVDTIPLVEFHKLKYDFVAFNGSNSKGLSMDVLNKNGSLLDTVFSRTGNLPLSVNADVNGLNAELKVINPNAFSITVEVLRFLTG